MKRLFIFLAFPVTLVASSPWDDVFKPQAHWQAVPSVEAKEKSLVIEPGPKTGVFTNAADPRKSGYLQSVGKFGDCTIETEFMIPKDSNSGIYLMGRYEVQILDSFGKEKVGYGDLGGIYQRSDPKRTPPDFDGVAPSLNAAKPAGEWQSLVIEFRAPRLDGSGNLLEKPIFLSVVLNGKEVQKNVTVSGPTISAQRQGWAAKDHLFIQGDHGPIAFRKFEVNPENFANPVGNPRK